MKIILSNGKECLVSRKDFKYLSGFNWYQKSGGRSYAFRIEMDNGIRRQVLMHREIMEAKEGDIVDHLNGNGLDNRRANLRIVDHRTNMRNTRKIKSKSTRYKGVCFEKQKKKYRATILLEGRQKHLGYFSKATEAAKAYDEAARDIYGFDAVYNFPNATERRATVRNS